MADAAVFVIYVLQYLGFLGEQTAHILNLFKINICHQVQVHSFLSSKLSLLMMCIVCETSALLLISFVLITRCIFIDKNTNWHLLTFNLSYFLPLIMCAHVNWHHLSLITAISSDLSLKFVRSTTVQFIIHINPGVFIGLMGQCIASHLILLGAHLPASCLSSICSYIVKAWCAIHDSSASWTDLWYAKWELSHYLYLS